MWKNPTLASGSRYFLLQPFNHLGRRISADLDEVVTLKFLVVSDRVGVGRLGGSTIDVEAAATFGAQLGIAPAERVTLQLGYLAGPSGLNGNRAWGQFFEPLLRAGYSGASV